MPTTAILWKRDANIVFTLSQTLKFAAVKRIPKSFQVTPVRPGCVLFNTDTADASGPTPFLVSESVLSVYKYQATSFLVMIVTVSIFSMNLCDYSTQCCCAKLAVYAFTQTFVYWGCSITVVSKLRFPAIAAVILWNFWVFNLIRETLKIGKQIKTRFLNQ